MRNPFYFLLSVVAAGLAILWLMWMVATVTAADILEGLIGPARYDAFTRWYFRNRLRIFWALLVGTIAVTVYSLSRI